MADAYALNFFNLPETRGEARARSAAERKEEKEHRTANWRRRMAEQSRKRSETEWARCCDVRTYTRTPGKAGWQYCVQCKKPLRYAHTLDDALREAENRAL